MRPLRSYFIPSIANMLFLAVFCHLAFSVGKNLLGDADTGYHIRAGEYILKTHSVPTSDLFSYHTPAYPWTAHEWLSEIIMALIHNVLGLTGVVLFFSSLIALSFTLLYRFIKSEGNNVLVILPVLILAIATSTNHWLARPHIFSFLLVVLWYGLLDRFDHTGKGRNTLLWALPLMMLFWVNLHGGYILGFVILGIYGISCLYRMFFGPTECRTTYRNNLNHLFLVGLACLLVALVNPFGLHILLFPFKLVGNSYLMDHVNEFLSPNFHGYGTFKLMIYLVLTVAAFSTKRFSPSEFLLVLLLFHMSLFSARYIPLFAIITSPIIIRKLQEFLDASNGRIASFIKERGKRYGYIDESSGGLSYPLVVLCITVWATATGTIDYGFSPKMKPVAAVEFMEREMIPGRMFNNDEFGDYIIYTSWPKYRVFFDGRSDMYGEKLMKEYYKVIHFEEGWESVLDKYGIGWIMFDTDSVFCRHLVCQPSWHLVYSDKVASIFVRRTPEYTRLIDRYPSTKLAVTAEQEKN